MTMTTEDMLGAPTGMSDEGDAHVRDAGEQRCHG